ncbi:MAG: hypothetical protein BWY85_00529 [Firmicutes bacterium ADurb.Bin506]|jgi:hypothetical protein|nr:MAG: hypothetical protein BWY85_00529 [Firmicutes bacterium ADurb.Bin506]
MSRADRHPHIDKPSEQQLSELLANKSPVLRQVYLDAHRLILDASPDVTYSTDCVDGTTSYGARQYGYDGWGAIALSAYGKWVSVFFMRGVELEAGEDLPEGTGRHMRHIKLRSPEELEEHRAVLRRLIESAWTLNMKHDPAGN